MTISKGTTIQARGYLMIGSDSQWLDNNDGEAIELKDGTGAVADSAGPFSDSDNNNVTWQRSPDGDDNWIFTSGTLGSANFGIFVSDPEIMPTLYPSSTPADIVEPLPAADSSVVGKEP